MSIIRMLLLNYGSYLQLKGERVLLYEAGINLYSNGLMEEAKSYLEGAFQLFEKLGDQSGIATSFGQLGRLAERRGALDTAATYYEKALELFVKIGQRQYERMAREDLQRVHSKLSGKNKS